jgi:hypothetical protein
MPMHMLTARVVYDELLQAYSCMQLASWSFLACWWSAECMRNCVLETTGEPMCSYSYRTRTCIGSYPNVLVHRRELFLLVPVLHR